MARKGVKYGAAALFDHMALDGLEDAYERGKAMGAFAEQCVDKFASAVRRRTSSPSRRPSVPGRPTKTAASTGRSRQCRCRQGRRDARQARRTAVQGAPGQDPGLKPAFKKDGTITAASSSSISDGAAALVLMRASTAAQRGLKPIARIVSHAVHAQAPEWFSTAPAGAIQKALAKAGWQPGQVELWEVNEAFAAVTMAAMAEFKLPHEHRQRARRRVCARATRSAPAVPAFVVTLLGALRKHGKRRGMAALCIGGGEATALAVEMI
jgi:acetyl-CoA C-acetyltransferase